MFATRRLLVRTIQENSRPSVCRVQSLARKVTESNVAASNFSRYPVPEFSAIPEDLQKRLAKYTLKSGELINVFGSMSYRPDELRAFMNYYEIIMAKRGSLTTAEKEMIALVTSVANKCYCCTVTHGAFHKIVSKDPTLADQLTVDWRNADLDKRQRAILQFAMDICHNNPITDEKIANLETLGLSRDDIWDIGSVVSILSLINRMISVMNVKPNKELHTMGRIPKNAK